jgi:hypothetical protein
VREHLKCGGWITGIQRQYSSAIERAQVARLVPNDFVQDFTGALRIAALLSIQGGDRQIDLDVIPFGEFFCQRLELISRGRVVKLPHPRHTLVVTLNHVGAERHFGWRRR